MGMVPPPLLTKAVKVALGFHTPANGDECLVVKDYEQPRAEYPFGEQMSERLTHITLVEKQAHKLLPGEATYSQQHQAWLIGCPAPNCGIGNLAGHDVTYDEQSRLLTVSPSILCGCGAHYFVERNQIQWV